MIFGGWREILFVSGLGTELRLTRRRARSATMQTPRKIRDFRPMNYVKSCFNLILLLFALIIALPTLRSQSSPRVNGDRMMEHLTAMAAIGKDPAGGYSRVAYSEADRQGREYVMGLMRAAKLDVSIDAAGNIIARRAGNDNSLRPVLFGSHVDSVPEGGNFDGVVGSLGAIEVAQTLFEKNVRTRHPLEVVIFQNEEGGL